MSAPMSDAFLVLAQAARGFPASWCRASSATARSNGLRFQRLKDKLGNRSNASSEVEFADAIGEMVGEPGAGIKTIMDMVTLTRLDCAVASSALMRAGLAEAVHHARHRQVFGKPLIDQPLMQRVLADMALDVAAATALSFRLARSFDEAAADRGEAAFARAMTPVVKYWVCKIAPALLYEAMECLGGNGYVEEAPLARYYREAPVNAIWEGSGNVMALDVLRVLAARRACSTTCWPASSSDLGAGGPAPSACCAPPCRWPRHDEGSARILTEQLALSAAAARTAAARRRADRRCLHRDAAGRPVARHLRHARCAPRCPPDHRYALSGDVSGRAGFDGPCAGCVVNLNDWFTLQARRGASPMSVFGRQDPMRHILTILIAFHWMAVFALLASFRRWDPSTAFLLRCGCSARLHRRMPILAAAALLAAGFLSFAFAVASLLFLWTLATALVRRQHVPGGDADRWRARAFGCGYRRASRCC